MSRFASLFQLVGLDPAVQTSFRRKQFTELTLPMALSLMEGGFVAVVAAKTFNVPPWVIAVISAAPMFGNLSSFIWNRIAAARPSLDAMKESSTSGFGQLVAMRHAARLADTPAAWVRPSMPPGSHPPQWP